LYLSIIRDKNKFKQIYKNIKNKLKKNQIFKNNKVKKRGIVIQIGENQIKCLKTTIIVKIIGIIKNI